MTNEEKLKSIKEDLMSLSIGHLIALILVIETARFENWRECEYNRDPNHTQDSLLTRLRGLLEIDVDDAEELTLISHEQYGGI